MLPGLTLPASWQGLLETFRPAFRRRQAFALFVLLASGLVAQTGRRSVVGMLAGAHLQAVVSFHRVCRFFSAAAWDPDRLGLLCARLVTERLLPPDAPVLVVVDDTLFKRWGRKVHGVFVTHDGSAPGPNKLARGNRWIICGIVVRLPGCSRPVCLPVLFRLWAGKATASPVELAAQLLGLIARELPDRRVHGVGDAAYHGKPLVIDHSTWTCRLPAGAALYAPAPPRTGKRGRPRTKGDKLGTPAELAAAGSWQQARVRRYGRDDTVGVLDTECLWYGWVATTPGRVVLVQDDGSTRSYDLAIYTLDLHTPAIEIVARYADRWPIEPANAVAKGPMGIGQARNRVERGQADRPVRPAGAVGGDRLVRAVRLPPRRHQRPAHRLPWYDDKTEPAFEDMLAKLRRTLIAARFTPVRTGQPDPKLIHDYALACAAAAA